MSLGLEGPEADRERSASVPASYPEVSFAFQPIVDVVTRQVVSYEALIRGVQNQPPPWVFGQVAAGDLHDFDQRSREVAIALATKLGIACKLNLNFLPRSLDATGEPIRATLATAERCGLSPDRLILEVTEGEVIDDHGRFAQIVNEFRGLGLQVAIDDFGAGHAGLNLLADFQPDLLKLDMHLIRDIGRQGPRQAIVRAITHVCEDLGIDVLAEGVETLGEYQWLESLGIRLYQGYLFARPSFAALLAARYP